MPFFTKLFSSIWPFLISGLLKRTSSLFVEIENKTRGQMIVDETWLRYSLNRSVFAPVTPHLHFSSHNLSTSMDHTCFPLPAYWVNPIMATQSNPKTTSNIRSTNSNEALSSLCERETNQDQKMISIDQMRDMKKCTWLKSISMMILITFNFPRRCVSSTSARLSCACSAGMIKRAVLRFALVVGALERIALASAACVGANQNFFKCIVNHHYRNTRPSLLLIFNTGMTMRNWKSAEISFTEISFSQWKRVDSLVV